MRFLAHAVFAIILVGSLTARPRAGEPLPDSIRLEPAVLRVASAYGWHLREHRTVSGVEALVFDAPGCSQPVEVIFRLPTFEEETIMQFARKPGYARRYVYIDKVWNTPDPWAAFVQRIKYSALFAFGLTDYAPSWHLLQVEAPAICQAAEAVDWLPVWRRDERAGQV